MEGAAKAWTIADFEQALDESFAALKAIRAAASGTSGDLGPVGMGGRVLNYSYSEMAEWGHQYAALIEQAKAAQRGAGKAP